MYYVVFARNKNKLGKIINTIHYEGASKSTAIEAFNTASVSAFNIDAFPGSLYFAGFKSDLPFIKEIKEARKASSIAISDVINRFLQNLSLATCLNTLAISGYKPAKLIEVHECEECDSKDTTVEQNVYMDYLCSKCWADYWNTRKSLAEYVIGLANGTYKLVSFSEADKAAIITAWNTNDVDDDGKEIKNSSNRQKLISSEAYAAEELDIIELKSGLSFTSAT